MASKDQSLGGVSGTEYIFYVITACTFFMLGSLSRFSLPVSAVGLS